MKKCSFCGEDITHKKSNRASKCAKCLRIPNRNKLEKIKGRTKGMMTVKREILAAYDRCCAICGWQLKTSYAKGKHLHQRGCEIHHIISVSEGGKHIFSNCILLCPNHHKEADMGIISKKELFNLVIKNKDKVIEDRKLKSSSKTSKIMDDLFS